MWTFIEFSSISIQGCQREGDARPEQEDADGSLPRGGRHRNRPQICQLRNAKHLWFCFSIVAMFVKFT